MIIIWYMMLIVSSLFLLPWLQLDTLSREDLVKFVKKQMVMFQKTKAKVEGKEHENGL